MQKRIITKLSSEQEKILCDYRNKWKSLAILTEPIDQEIATAMIKVAYAASNYPAPEILFYRSPLAAVEGVISIKNFKDYLGRNIRIKLYKRVFEHVQDQIKRQFEEGFYIKLRNKIQFPEFPYYPTESHPQFSYFPYSVTTCTQQQLVADLYPAKYQFTDISYLTRNLARPADWAVWGCMFDFCISTLKLGYDKEKWEALHGMMQSCGFIFQFEKICILCDRPFYLSFDEENMLHADQEPALQFVDGYSVYAFHGKHPSEEE